LEKRKVNYLWEVTASFLAILFYFTLLMRAWHSIPVTGYWSAMLLLTFEGFLIVMFVIRKIPKDTSMALEDWLIALLGTILPTFFLLTGHGDTAFLHGLQVTGMLVALAGVFSLNRSFGLVAANRGVKTSGIYQFIRHPVYAGYFISFLAFFLQNICLYNLIILVTFYVVEVMRIFAEEKFLSQDQQYKDYMKKVRWRLLPAVF